jgi:hypothetical protein
MAVTKRSQIQTTNSGDLWKQRYEKLKQFMADAEYEIRNEKLEVSNTRDWDAAEFIYVSFSNDVCDSEDHAIDHYGKGKFDVYKLHRKGDE